MRQAILVSVLIVVSAAALAACSKSPDDAVGGATPLGGVICTDDLRAGLVVEVRDAATGAPAAAGAVGTIRSGNDEQTLDVEGGMQVPPELALQLVGAWECAGTFDVWVEKPGYEVWTRAGVVVTADECHVKTERLRANLVPHP